jgi:chorismate-pyruvate lyase
MPESVPAGSPGELFDPTRAVFVATEHRPPGCRPIDISVLTPVQRALLVIDGTVTQFLEAYYLENVIVAVLAQHDDEAGAADARWLDCAADDAVLRRSVRLLGESSGGLFAWAESVILPARLSAAMRRGLDTEPSGLGQIIIDSRLETRREALWFGEETPGTLPAELGLAPGTTFLSRSYRIIADRQPLMLICERFPLSPPS